MPHHIPLAMLDYPYQLPFGLSMLAAFGGVTWAAWTENLPIGTGWRERLLIKLVGESGVFKAYLIFGGVGVLFSLGMLVWGIILLF